MKLQKPKLEGIYIPFTPKVEDTSIETLKMYYKETIRNMDESYPCNKQKLLRHYRCTHILECSQCILSYKNLDKLKQYLDEWDNYNKTIKENEQEFLKEKIKKADEILKNV